MVELCPSFNAHRQSSLLLLLFLLLLFLICSFVWFWFISSNAMPVAAAIFIYLLFFWFSSNEQSTESKSFHQLKDAGSFPIPLNLKIINIEIQRSFLFGSTNRSARVCTSSTSKCHDQKNRGNKRNKDFMFNFLSRYGSSNSIHVTCIRYDFFF